MKLVTQQIARDSLGHSVVQVSERRTEAFVEGVEDKRLTFELLRHETTATHREVVFLVLATIADVEKRTPLSFSLIPLEKHDIVDAAQGRKERPS